MPGKGERTKQMIIEKGAALFNEKGIAGTSIDAVLDVTKIAKGSLYGYFASKEELSHAIVDHLLERLIDLTSVAMNKETSAKKKLFAFFDVYKAPLAPPLQGGCPILNFGVESDYTDPIVRKKVKKVIQFALDNLTAIINRGIQDKEFKPDFDAAGFALKSFTLIEGSMMVSKVLNSNKPMQQVTDMLRKEIEGHEIKPKK